MLNSLNLDDRTYNEIRQEAIANIVKHCPTWTNHNASDPGIALVELFSAMTEMMQYRFNQVPDKNYMAFLDMLGIDGNFVSPATSRVAFNLVENFEQTQEEKTTKHILAGTQFITKDKEVDDRPLIFETIEDTYISNIKLNKIISKSYNNKKDKYQFNIHNTTTPFTPFQDNDKTDESLIYLKDKSFAILVEANIITLIFSIDIKQATQMNKNWFEDIIWEYFNGEIWKPLKSIDTSLSIQKRYEASTNAEHFFVTFSGNNLDLKSTIKDDLSKDEGYYIRGKVDVEANSWIKNEDIKIYEIYKESATSGEGIKPNKLLFNDTILDLNNRLYPFGDEPKEYDTFIIEDELFSKIGQDFTLHFKRDGEISNILKIEWEYPIDKNEWYPLKLNLDSTENLNRSGSIQFIIPSNFHYAIIHGEKCFAIRAKIKQENYTEEKEKKETAFYKAIKNQEEPIRNPLQDKLDVPYFNDIKISYTEKKQIIEHCYIYNNGNFIREIQFHNKTKDNVKKSFLSENLENDTSLYFGFNGYLRDDYLDIFFEVKDNVFKNEDLALQWEIYHDKSWKTLKVIKDTTKNLNKTGDIRFKIDKHNRNDVQFNLKGMWIRSKFSTEKSSISFSNTINKVLLNTTIVHQQETLKNEFIGTSIGIPNMKFHLNHKNIVYPPEISIGEEIYKPIKRKKRFLDYDKDALVYKVNSLNGEITFGDNEYAAIPNPKEDIYAINYAISHGENGNIGKGNLKLRTTIQSLDSATNIIPATGGANAETLNDLIQRAPETLRIKNRVVTVKDYENASIDFSPYILKAKAISRKESDINIFVITKNLLEEKSMKNEIILQELEEHLKKMSLITVQPKVILPKIIQINIKIKLISTVENKKIDNDFKTRLEQRTRDYFDITKNFPMGKLVISEADLYKILHQESFEYYYNTIKIWKTTDVEPSDSTQFEINSEDEVIKLNNFEIED